MHTLSAHRVVITKVTYASHRNVHRSRILVDQPAGKPSLGCTYVHVSGTGSRHREEIDNETLHHDSPPPRFGRSTESGIIVYIVQRCSRACVRPCGGRETKEPSVCARLIDIMHRYRIVRSVVIVIMLRVLQRFGIVGSTSFR